jgi:hypothetical protein
MTGEARRRGVDIDRVNRPGPAWKEIAMVKTSTQRAPAHVMGR